MSCRSLLGAGRAATGQANCRDPDSLITVGVHVVA